MVATDTKRCSQCKAVKPLADFHNRAQSADGKCPSCKACTRLYSIKYNREHSEEIKAKSKIYHQSHTEEDRVYGLRYRKEHGEENNARRRLRHREDPRQNNARCKAYRETHKEERWLYNGGRIEENMANLRRRHARKFSVSEDFSPREVRFVRFFWDNHCAICGKSRKEEGRALAIDHWYPLSKGHALTMKNAVLMCRSCNAGKRDRYPMEIFDAETIERIEARIRQQTKAWWYVMNGKTGEIVTTCCDGN